MILTQNEIYMILECLEDHYETTYFANKIQGMTMENIRFLELLSKFYQFVNSKSIAIKLPLVLPIIETKKIRQKFKLE